MVFFAGSRPGAMGGRGPGAPPPGAVPAGAQAGRGAQAPPAAPRRRACRPAARESRRTAGRTPADSRRRDLLLAMSNIDLEIGEGNPGAVCVRGTYAQHSFLAHMDFRVGPGIAGVHDTGNVMEDVRFFGGQYGIWTRTPSPSWQFTAVDAYFQGQREAAIREWAAGLTLIRPHFRNVPTAVSIDATYHDELWIKTAGWRRSAGRRSSSVSRTTRGPKSTWRTSSAAACRRSRCSARARRRSRARRDVRGEGLLPRPALRGHRRDARDEERLRDRAAHRDAAAGEV